MRNPKKGRRNRAHSEWQAAKHIVDQKAGHFEPDKFEDQYETALIDLINAKRAGTEVAAPHNPGNRGRCFEGND